MAANHGSFLGLQWRDLKVSIIAPHTGWPRRTSRRGTELGVDLPKVGGCVEGTWNEDDGGVHFGLPADNYCVRGDPPNSQRMQAGGAQEGGNTMPLVVGTANGLRRPQCNWIRRISPGLCFSLLYGVSTLGVYKTMACVGLSLV